MISTIFFFLDLTNEDCWLQAIPDDVIACSCEDMEVYFQWIVDIQQNLADWKREFSKKILNYDSIEYYIYFYINLNNIGAALCAPFLVAGDQTVVSALNLGQELKLPVEAVFGIEEMSSLLASGEFVRPFCQLR